MKRLRFSLFSKIMLWFFLNLLILGGLLLIIFNFRFDSRSASSFFRSSNRIEALTRQIESELNEKTRAERDEILKKYSGQYAGVEFFLFDNKGQQLGGRETRLPEEIYKEVSRPENQFSPRAAATDRNNAPVEEFRRPPPMPMPMPMPNAPPPSVYFKTANPTVYWFVGRILTSDLDKSESFRTRLIAASTSFTGGGLFFDFTPYILLAFVIIGFSTAFWFPFVRGITKSIGQVTGAAEKISDEEFDVRVSDKRGDELGRLGAAINHLAQRLSGFVTGQKRFLGDISHELNSPLARMQFALSILEDRVDEANRVYVEDVKEEVELMSRLVSELLEYSKAGIKAPHVALEKIALRPLVERVAARETANEDDARISIEIENDVEVSAQPELLSRAVANVLRNAVRYAGKAGEINISAAQNGHGANQIKLIIADHGAGVPADALEKLFDPFYRVETHRSRETGGTGLGLAIVKTCVEACRGKVSAENLSPKGFAVNITLNK